MKDKIFKFYMPVELLKSENDNSEEGDWRIKGIASTPDEDLQGEVVDPAGLDISLLKAGRGLFNFDHLKGPENIIGQIEDARFVKANGKAALEVEGYLFKHQDRGKAFYNILKSIKKGAGPRVHLSIEGKILQRDLMNSSKISKARIDKVALTFDPVNPYTYADLVKCINTGNYEEKTEKSGGIRDEAELQGEDVLTLKRVDIEKLIDIAQKALSAGAGYSKAPAARTGGEAMSTESMDKKPKKMTYDKDKKKKLLKSLIEQCIETFPEEDPLELASFVLSSFSEKVE